MAEKDKRFYWLKLHKEFMNSEMIDYLMSQPNGADYVVLYQMIALNTLNTKGELCSKIGEALIPFDTQKIRRECKWFSEDTIMVAMEAYKRLGLIYENEKGILKLANYDDMVGSESYWAKQKKKQKEIVQSVGQSLENFQQSVGQSLENFQFPLISSIYISNDLNSNTLKSNNNEKLLQCNDGVTKCNDCSISKIDDNKGDEDKNDTRFEQFWGEYPKKINKQGCYRAFRRIPKLDSEFERIMEALRREKQSKQWRTQGGQFIPYPLTWLNQKRWEAQVDEQKAEKVAPPKSQNMEVLRKREYTTNEKNSIFDDFNSLDIDNL